MKQLKYAWEDLIEKKGRNFVLFLQILAALIVFSLTIKLILDLNFYQNQIDHLTKEQEVFALVDNTDELTFSRDIINSEDASERLVILYEFMKNDDKFNSYTVGTGHSMFLDSSTELPDSFIRFSSGDRHAYNMVRVDENFIEVFNLKCTKGEKFASDDFISSEEAVPILLGYEFLDYYDLGDVISSGEIDYQVKGFLESLSYYINPLRSGDILWLDRTFVVPFQSDRFNGVVDYENVINSTYFITDQRADLQPIIEKSKELNLFTFGVRSFSEQMDNINRDITVTISFLTIIFLVVLLFCIIGLVCNLIQFINERKQEFAVHLLCGGRVGLIIARILLQVLSLVFLANIIVISIHRISTVSFITIIFSVLLTFVVTLYPVVKLYRTPISTILRRS
ncbi:hypothetical protein PRVXH_001849 [Proteinivorax hydrogeniformans]|uniref:Uncharacterized protein n=1 Tax=Proteinivorax hydrogeniformans TaxID=1826727 RepID=A0AAU8HS35_9FIRM